LSHRLRYLSIVFVTASASDRSCLGLPLDWARIQAWLDNSTLPHKLAAGEVEPKPRKFPEIPVMKDYDKVLPDDFWKNFPSYDLPKSAFTKVNIEVLDKKIESCKVNLLHSEYARAKKCVQYLRYGAPSFQPKKLPGCVVKNSVTALKFGTDVTDVIASWVDKKYVCGPFKSPPVTNFRANSILAVPQPGKVRVCLNVSLPKGKSFNDNIIPSRLEKVNMTSAHKFGFAILRAGRDSIMLKFDKIDAYKNVPAKIQDLNYQGFMWGGRYFMETRQMFGSKASVQNYDILGNTIVSLILSDCKIPRKQVLRQLDDTPAVAPRGSGWSEEFSMKYKSLCKDINLELADPCPNFDKAFDCSKKGKVLGVYFDTTELSWKLPNEKVDSILQSIAESLENKKVQLKQMQCLMGKLNHVAQMCPFLNIP
jgi:hypothetical protein